MQVNQIAPMDLEGAPTFLEAARELEGFLNRVANESGCGQLALAAYNAEFDFKFINAELGRRGRPAIGLDRMVDTLALAKRKHPAGP
ncbi:hypothetical protein EO238_24730, partial [Citrobacter sp. AAK_AS5]